MALIWLYGDNYTYIATVLAR